ncbi:MAG: sugar ABC transporter permease, partial [Chloroflexota bacterium]|nr:sugar ABC transporter permease [Chloroflexota bacterium]
MWQAFWHLTLPFLRPLVLVVLLLRLVGSFKLFDQIFSLTQAGPGNATEVLAYYIYVLGFRQFNLGYAATVSYLLLAILALVSIFLIRRLGREAGRP